MDTLRPCASPTLRGCGDCARSITKDIKSFQGNSGYKFAPEVIELERDKLTTVTGSGAMDIDRTSSNDDPYRLPTNVKPSHYDLAVQTDLKTLAFRGVVKISLDVVVNTSKIVLNSWQIVLGHAVIYSHASKTHQPAIFESYDETQQRALYTLKEPLPAGSKAELKIPFHSTLADTTRGYFKTSWERNGKKEYYSLTQLAPTAARRVFPCWDEPALKATFAVTLISRADTVNLSNMSIISEEVVHHANSPADPDLAELLAPTTRFEDGESELEEWKITKFGISPPMPVYTLAFANGPFEFLEAEGVLPLSGRTIPLRVYSTPDLIHQAHYALDVKATVLPLYETLLDVEYPLPKLDTLIAHDFEGAMENWGLIMATASAYLLDPNRADEAGKRALASVQSHEIAHMWFGNITTMEWWTYIYLNEGFATLMGEVIMIDKVFPAWKATSEFLSAHLDKSLALDAKLSSHPVEIEVLDARNVNQIFDTLSYSKAASVLRMLCAHVGEDKFIQGVTLYLKKHLLANTVTNDLWEGIGSAAGVDVARIMENWITKTGYPVLSVAEDPDKKGIRVRQDRFLETGIGGGEDNETIWHVPLGLLTTKDSHSSINHNLILGERGASIELDTTQPFKLNADTTGYYRVLYTPERLEKIAIEAAKDSSIFSLNDKIGLVQDAFALAKAGLTSLGSCLTLVNLWKCDEEYLVWQAISNGVGELASIWWEDVEVMDKLNRFRRSLFVPLVNRFGYEYDKEEPSDTSLLRTLAVEQALDAGDERVIQKLRSRFKHYMDTGDDSKIPVNLQRATFIAAVKYGGREEYDEIRKIMDNPKTALEKSAAIYGMTAPQDPTLLKETTKYITEKSRNHDMVRFIRFMAMNFKARRLLTKYFEDEYEVLYKRLEDNFTLGYLIKYCFEFYSGKKDRTEIEEFFKYKDTTKYSQSLGQALDNIRARTAYIECSTEDLVAWLDQDRE